jgi:hypothetical protein
MGNNPIWKRRAAGENPSAPLDATVPSCNVNILDSSASLLTLPTPGSTPIS